MRVTTPVLLLALFAALLPTARASMPDLDLDQYRGKVVYLDFWASWCEPCRKSFPWMNAMQKAYGGRGLVVIAVNVDTVRNDADHFLRTVPANFQVLYDPAGDLAQRYRLVGMPSAFLVDRDGRIVTHHVGFTSDSPRVEEAEIQRLLVQISPTS